MATGGVWTLSVHSRTSPGRRDDYISTKTERLEVRVDAATKERIEAAAARLDQSASALVVHAATVEADRVLAHTETTVMPAEQFDALLAALDMADEASALARLAQRERSYHHP